jgi:regulatory protein YycI of two-component signal transduction system YycFG
MCIFKGIKWNNMTISESAHRLRDMIENAIEDHVVTRAEMDMIMHIATEDGHIDSHEQALLNQLQDMIENKLVKLVP